MLNITFSKEYKLNFICYIIYPLAIHCDEPPAKPEGGTMRWDGGYDDGTEIM